MKPSFKGTNLCAGFFVAYESSEGGICLGKDEEHQFFALLEEGLA